MDTVNNILGWVPTLPSLENPVIPKRPDIVKEEIKATANGDVETKFADLAFTIENVFEVIVGFAAGTSIIEGPSLLVCSAGLKDYIDKVYEIIVLYE